MYVKIRLYNKGCPKINARFEFAAIFASSCWQPWRKNGLTAEEKFYRIIIQIKTGVYSRYKMSFNKFNFRIVYFNIILIEDNFKKCTNRSSISFKEFYVEIWICRHFCIKLLATLKKEQFDSWKSFVRCVNPKTKTLFHI